MRPYLVLDTDVASHLQMGRLDGSLHQLVIGHTPCVTFVTVGEFYRGAFRRGWGPQRIAKLESWLRNVVVLPYNFEVGRSWGRLVAQMERVGRPMQANDAWIAACCLTWGLPLMTLNRRHFEHVPDLRVLPEPPGMGSV